MNPHVVEQLASHVTRLVKAKADIQAHTQEGRRLREYMHSEEAQIAILMNKLSIGECTTNDVCIRITNCKKEPTASFKNLLPLIERVFSATPEKMATFLQEVKHFKQSNSSDLTKVVCKTKKVKNSQVKRSQSQSLPQGLPQGLPQVALHQVPSVHQTRETPTPSLASALSSY